MIGIGHLGIGGMGSLRLDRFRKGGDARSVIAWSRSEKTLANYKGGETTTDWRVALDHPAVEAVCIATPTSVHYELASAALEAGKHVLVEGPAVQGTEDFDRLVETARRNRRVFYCGSDYRFLEPCRAAELAVPYIGQVLRAQMDSSWRPAEGTWYYDQAVSGGVFLCVHIFPFTFLHLLGAPRWVDATLGDRGRYGVAHVGYDSGASGIATGGYRDQATDEVLIIGTEGVMRREAGGKYVVARGDNTEELPLPPLDSVVEDNAGFLRCIRGEEDWESHLPRERAAHAAAVAARESASQAVRVEIF